jgi:hypothetical protein
MINNITKRILQMLNQNSETRAAVMRISVRMYQTGAYINE